MKKTVKKKVVKKRFSRRKKVLNEDDLELPRVNVFRAGEELVAGNAGIISVTEGFKRLVAGVVENNVRGAVISCKRLENPDRTIDIAKKVGPKSSIKLAHLRGILVYQAESFLTVVRVDSLGAWVVRARWDSFLRGWNLDAYETCDPFEWKFRWEVGDRVLSQKIV